MLQRLLFQIQSSENLLAVVIFSCRINRNTACTQEKRFTCKCSLYVELCYCQYHSLFVEDTLKSIYTPVHHSLLLPILFPMKPPLSLKLLPTIILQFFLLLVYTAPWFCHSYKHGYESHNQYYCPDSPLAKNIPATI